MISQESELLKTDIIAYLKQHEDKEMLRFITCGSVDDGKSTLIGRLLHDSKLIYEDQLKAMRKDPQQEGEENLDLASIVDGLQAEREQGITIDVAYRFFSTEKRKFIIADTPGHEQYTRNMATGASNAELAVILIDARQGVLTQTRRHSFIVHLLGIKHIVVAINKMDLVDFDESIYKKIKDEYQEFSKDFEFSSIYFIPVSALKGDNIVDPSDSMPWYNGPSLMHILENLDTTDTGQSRDFRFPVQYVQRPDLNFRGYSGTIASGEVSKGDLVTILPSRKESRVDSIVTFDGELKSAFSPQSVTITLTDEIDISRGDILVKSEQVPEVSDRFDAYIVWMSEEPLTEGKIFQIKRASTLMTGHVEKIHYRIDINTFKNHETSHLNLNEIAYCRLNLSSPIAYDMYKNHRHTGSFILIDRLNNNTVGVGMIAARQDSRNVVWHQHTVDKEARIRIKGHKPVLLWFTGLSGSGKSTIANALEERLNRAGLHSFLLDGDNIRHGLNQDLTFSNEDRHENIRRIAEIGKLFTDAGLLVLTSFISPFRSDRAMARSLVDKDEFIEIFVDTPLELCENRDPKGLYKRARSGEIKGFTGINSPYEAPDKAELHIETAEMSVEESVEKILAYLKDRKILSI